MALKPTTAFPGKIAPADASYPFGKARNITAPGDGLGTPFNAALLNDVWGFFQHLLQRAGITPSETPDTAPVSQYGDSVRKLADSRLGAFAANRWTLRTGAVVGQQLGVAWSPTLSLFAAVSDTGAGTVQTSPDGITWTARTTPAGGWANVIWAPGPALFVATAGNAGTQGVMTSADGITWTLRTTPGGFGYYNVAWSPELALFVAVGIGSKIATSPDGFTWTARAAPGGMVDTFLFTVAWSASLSKFVAITANQGVVISSPDGITWALGPTIRPGGPFVKRVAWSPEHALFVLVGSASVHTSPDGITWTSRTVPAVAWNDVVWSKEFGLFVVVGQFAVIISPDGITWTSRTTVTSKQWGSVTVSAERLQFIAGALGAAAANIMTSL